VARLSLLRLGRPSKSVAYASQPAVCCIAAKLGVRRDAFTFFPRFAV